MAKITVDKTKCIGCGSCVALCQNTFKIVNNKSVVQKKEVKNPACEKNAEASCPVQAITVKE